MKSKTNKICRLSTVLDETLPDVSLAKIIGTSVSEQVRADSILDKTALMNATSLELVSTELEMLEDEDAMAHFIDKYSASHFHSLDELLAAHTAHPYEVKVQASSNDKLFEGLEAILGD